MDFSICRLTDSGISVRAPLAPNINLHGTGFAGSLYSLAVLAGWALTSHMLSQAGLDHDVVVASSAMKFRTPVVGDIRCDCDIPEATRKAFIQRVRQSGRSRLSLNVIIGSPPEASLDAIYMAIPQQRVE